MFITCPNCMTSYSVNPASLGDDGRKVRCSNCGHQWHQKPVADRPPPPPPDPVPHPPQSAPYAPGPYGQPPAGGYPPPYYPPPPPQGYYPPPGGFPPPPQPGMPTDPVPAAAPIPAAEPVPEPEPEPEPDPFADDGLNVGDPDGQDQAAPEFPDDAQPDFGALDEDENDVFGGSDPFQDDDHPDFGDEPDDPEPLTSLADDGDEADDMSDIDPQSLPDPDPIPQVFTADIDEDGSEAAPSGGRGGLVKILLIVLAVVLLLGGFGMVWFKESVIAAMPGTAGFYDMIGLTDPIDAGLEMQDTVVEPASEGSEQTMLVRVVVANVSEISRPAPNLRFVLTNEVGEAVQTKVVSPLQPTIEAGSRVAYRTVFRNLDPTASRLDVEYTADPADTASDTPQ